MDSRGIEVLSQSVNMPVLRMAGQNFPGVLIQGDTLSSLFALSRMIQRRSQEVGEAVLVDLAQEMTTELSTILQE